MRILALIISSKEVGILDQLPINVLLKSNKVLRCIYDSILQDISAK